MILAPAKVNLCLFLGETRLSDGRHELVTVFQSLNLADELTVEYRIERGALVSGAHPDVRLISSTPDEIVLDVAGVRRGFAISRYSTLTGPATVEVDSPLGAVTLTVVDRFPDPSAQLAAGSLVAPMPGTVVRVAVEVGANVSTGQPLLWLEAMKMEHQISAPSDGVVSELNVSPGQQVDVGAVLAVVSDNEETKE